MVAINNDLADIPSVNLAVQGSDITAPGAARAQLYVKSTGLYVILSDGSIAELPLRGSASQYLRMNAGGTAVEWASLGTALLGEHVAGVGGVATLDVTGIAATAKRLIVEAHLRGDNATAGITFTVKLNNDGGANYSYLRRAMYATTIGQTEGLAQTSFGAFYAPAASAGAGMAASLDLLIPDYADTTFHKVYFARAQERENTTGSNQNNVEVHGTYISTAAISRVTLTPSAGNFVEGSSLRVWGL